MKCSDRGHAVHPREPQGDLEDLGSDFDGAPGLEFRHAGTALGLERCGLSYQRHPARLSVPGRAQAPGAGGDLRGRARERADEARRRDRRTSRRGTRSAYRAGTWRGYEAGPEELEILVFGAAGLGDEFARRRGGPARLVGRLVPCQVTLAGARAPYGVDRDVPWLGGDPLEPGAHGRVGRRSMPASSATCV